MTSEVALCAISVCSTFLLLNEVKKGKRKRWWSRNLFAGGVSVGLNLLEKLKLEDGMGFSNFTRMTPSDFEELLQMFGGKISKCDTRFRETIPASIRLAVSIRFLASGESFTSPMYTFRISKQSISRFVPDVCEAIITLLKRFVKVS